MVVVGEVTVEIHVNRFEVAASTRDGGDGGVTEFLKAVQPKVLEFGAAPRNSKYRGVTDVAAAGLAIAGGFAALGAAIASAFHGTPNWKGINNASVMSDSEFNTTIASLNTKIKTNTQSQATRQKDVTKIADEKTIEKMLLRNVATLH